MLSTRSSLLPYCGKSPVDFVIDDQSVIAPDRFDLRVFDRRETVGHHREPGNAERHGAQDLLVVQRHLQTLVVVLVVHVMDAVHGMHIGLCQPLHHAVELRHDVIVLENVALDGKRCRCRPASPLTSSRPPLMA